MVVIKILLVVIETIVCLLLVGAILIQKSRGYGIGTALGGMGETVFGAHMGTVLTKATVILGVIFLVTTALLAFVGGRVAQRTSVTERAGTPMAPAAPMQAGPTTGGPMGPAPDAASAPMAPGDVPVELPTGPAPAADAAAPIQVPVPAPVPAAP